MVTPDGHGEGIVRYWLEIAPAVRSWLRELGTADPPAARLVGEAVTALLTAGTLPGEPLVVRLTSVLLEPDPALVLDHAYQTQLDLMQQVRRGIANLSTGRAAPPQEMERLTELSHRLQREVDRFRTYKEVVKAVYNTEVVTAELNAVLAGHDETDPETRTGPDAGARLAAAQAKIDGLLATTKALEQEVRNDPFLAPRLSPPPPPPAPAPPRDKNLYELHPGGTANGEIRIVFATTPTPDHTVVLLAARQTTDDPWPWHQQAIPAAEHAMAERPEARHSRTGRRIRPGYSRRWFLREYFPGHTREIRAGAARWPTQT